MRRNEPPWLQRLREQLADLTAPAAGELWPSPGAGMPAFFNYRMEHVRQVERDARALLDAVGGDADVVLAAVWTHDRCEPAFGVEAHGRMAAEWAGEHLADTGFPPAKVRAVCFAVAHHSDAPGAIPPEAHEARVLWDADKLAHSGPHEVLTLLMNNIAADRLRELADDSAFPDQAFTLEGFFRAKLAHLLGKELRSDRFYFGPSRRWAGERFQALSAFVACLHRQVAAGAEPGEPKSQ